MNTILRKTWSVLWQSVLLGLGGMMIVLLIMNACSLSWVTPDSMDAVTWTEEVLTETQEVKTYLPSYTFPLFPALYTPKATVYPQFLLQCLGFICAAAGAIGAVRIVRKESLPMLAQLLIAPLSVLLGFTPLLLQLRIYNSPTDLFLIPTLLVLCALIYAALVHHKRRVDVDRINAALDKSRSEQRTHHLMALAPFDYLSGSYTALSGIYTFLLAAVLLFTLWTFIVDLLGGSPIPLTGYRW